MDVYLRHNPGDARFFRVKLDENRHPNLEDIAKAAQDNVQIRIDLDQTLRVDPRQRGFNGSSSFGAMVPTDGLFLPFPVRWRDQGPI